VALEGRLLAPEEARALGLVEAVVPPGVLLEQARGRAAGLAALPPPAFRDVKQALREPVATAVRRVEREDARRWVETAFSPAARERLGEVVRRLTRPRQG
jgi:enoyl-CoA hydratase/carnithine racemase